VLLHMREWGEPDAPVVVCLHGITAHGLRFRKLAEERLSQRFRVLVPDLRGHGRSGWDPPWSIAAHVADLEETIDAERAVWLGHSFGGRLVLELAARDPARVARAILLDPSLHVLPHVAFDMAEEERKDVSYANAEAAIEARIASGRVLHTPRELLEEEMAAHLEPGLDGGLRFRYCRGSAITAWSELATPAPAYRSARVPTLIVLGEQSWLVLDSQLEEYAAALGNLLEVVKVPGGHTVYWDAFAETADAIERFLR
jgi:lipase